MSQSLLEIRDLCKVFDRGKNSEVVAAHHINLTIKAGECISVVGESGCGKSTLAKLVTMILKADSGQIIFDGEDLVKLGPRKLRLKRQKMQMVFQQPMSAISPRMTIGEFMKIPLRNFNIVPKHMMEEEVDHLLAMVSLPAYYKNKLPHEVSGGELQRVMIARAMAGHPALLIFDEATSALDVAVQQEIVELINRLQKETGVACIFITHDLSLVHQVSQRVVVMYRGRIVEEMGSHNIVSKCLHPYSKLLISSVFTVQCDQNRIPDVLPEDIKVEKHPDSCPFYGRCPKGCAACGEIKNILMPIPRDEGHQIACQIVVIALLKMVSLVGISIFASSIGSVLGNIFNLQPGSYDWKTDLLWATLASVLIGIGDLLVGEAEHRCTASARIHLRQQIFEKMLKLDVSDVDRLGATSTINSAVDGVELMQVYYNRYLPGLIYSVLAPIYLFFALRRQCMPTAVFLLIMSLLVTPINNIFKVINDKMKGDYWRTLNSLTSYYLESINGLTTTELFNRGDDREKSLGGIAKHLRDIICDVMILNFSSTALNELLINVSIVVSTMIVCLQLKSGNIALQNALTVLMMSYSFFGSIRALQWIAHDALHGVAAAQNVADILDINTEKTVSENIKKSYSYEGIRFENVSFGYRERSQVLSGINLEIPHNKVTAIAGESGCGKSTIVNMLLRFYDPTEGRITFNGRDFLSYDPTELRRQIIMVPQSVFVFSGTVRENLLIARENASEESLREVLGQVKLLDWIDSQPLGLDTPVGDAGARLSGGQRQKIGIARALLCEAEYIIFDEATSSVDEENEKEIWACIGELAKTRTLIIISHRLSTIRNADVIYLIENGMIAEYGKHEQLIKNEGKYSKLVQEQDALEKIEIRKQYVDG